MTEQLAFPTRLAWCDENPEAWALIRELAEECVSRRKHFGMRWLLEVARYEMTVKRGVVYRVNNNDQKALGERLRAEVPGASELMESRRRSAA